VYQGQADVVNIMNDRSILVILAVRQYALQARLNRFQAGAQQV